MSIQFTFEIEPDETGVIDGRVLAHHLITEAFHAIVPYVNGCPGCADALFTTIANGALEAVHRRGQEQGELNGVVHRPGLGFDEAAIDNHFANAAETTRALVKSYGHRSSALIG